MIQKCKKEVDNKNTFYSKVIVVTVDNKLKLDKDVEHICKKACRKLNFVAIISNYIDHLKPYDHMRPHFSV